MDDSLVLSFKNIYKIKICRFQGWVQFFRLLVPHAHVDGLNF